ncbi:MAG: hypothetical protein IPK07_08815 [Deltaproteobacteria bacterium]|nr:hypothetical protein [Deltaproteobacteria bacterium]
MRVSSWAAASVPAVALALIAWSAAYVRLSFGGWPVIHRDAVEGPLADLAVTVTALATLTARAAIVLLPALAVVRRATRVRPVLGGWAVCLAVTWVVAYALVDGDPAGFIDWVLD